MFYLDFCIFIKLVVILNFANSENLLVQTGKFSEDDVQICLDSFAVHTDKIIRTQDSLALGAKYLMEAELDNRQDCLKLCCKTNECDVFVFEEKKQGSCYLFHCGPPHDFKCKFTSHVNYSSAVLTNLNIRSHTHLEEQMRHSQQEHELKSLRKMVERPLEYSFTPASIVVQSATEIPVVIKPISTTSQPIKPECSRNQYECRSSHDCIAIYNVCDGIPQCSDASDEASDLGCPTEKSTSPPVAGPPRPPPPPPEPPVPAHELKYPLHHKYPPLYGNPELAKTWHQVYPQQGVQYPLPQVPNYGPGYVNAWDYRQMYDQQTPFNKDAFPVNPKDNGLMPHYAERQHIFNHKRPGGDNPDETPYLDPERYDPYYPRQLHESWQQPAPLPDVPKLLVTIPPVVLTRKESRQDDRHPDAKNDKASAEGISTKETVSIKKELETQKSVNKEAKISGDKTEHLSGKDKDDLVDNKNVHVEKASEKVEKHEVRVHHYAEHLQSHNKDVSNEILKPRGAVISLALGLTVTAIMVALFTCRLRVLRKRGKRHGPFAHDADYLVNGMYL
ncbi:uncharacterized protein LOC123267734 [Cotesia glomerata]|uniref:uncharacterized protein LOC123267734 n=1 Tax=Cotesia glomerata TaxID=32391 RepID=UPI001D00E7F9|nr:uncharacterized protein LOC123267734 [Cotesia glomerata]